MTKNDYLEIIDEQIIWHDKKSSENKRNHMRCKVIIICFTSVISFFSVLCTVFHSIQDAVNLLTATLATAVAIIKTYTDEKQHNYLYIFYRITCEKLKQEKYRFSLNLYPYDQSEKENLEIFFSECEEILNKNINSWQQIHKNKHHISSSS